MPGRLLRVLTYHRIGRPGEGGRPGSRQVSATAEAFERQMRHLARFYRVVSLNDVLESQRGSSRLPRRAVLITFDDGYRDFDEVAWPILKRLGLPATVFVPTAYPDHPEYSFWWDRVRNAVADTDQSHVAVPGLGVLDLATEESKQASVRRISSHVKSTQHATAMRMVERLLQDLGTGPPPTNDVLSWDALRRLAGEGVSVAPHTRNHPALNRLEVPAVKEEVAGSIRDIEREIGVAPLAFCYPYGLHNDTAVRIAAEEGIELAFTCLDGHNRIPAEAPLGLRRTEITQRTTPLIFAVRLSRLATYVDSWRHRHKYTAEEATGGHYEPPGTPGRGLKVAYVMSRFPKLSETFILTELEALDQLGIELEVFPLLREHQDVAHPEAERWTRRARFEPFVSLPILKANLEFMVRRPHAYFSTLWEVLRGTLGSLNFFVGALAIFPKSVWSAYQASRLGVRHVHAHFANHPTVAALIIHRLTGIPFSFTAHGSDLHKDRRMLPKKVAAAKFAVTVSNFNRELMIRECGEQFRSKIHVVHCGIDPDFFSPVESRSLTSPFEIVCVASLEEVKGHRFLVEACRLLRERGISFRCHLIGDGPVRLEIMNQIHASDLEEHVVLHGGVPRKRVAEMLTSVDAAVLASHPTPEGKREGIPVALMEAMASGLPVVATAITGIPELVDDGVTGILVPSGDPVALADGLERLARDAELRSRMGSAGRAKVVSEFNLYGAVEKLLALMQ